MFINKEIKAKERRKLSGDMGEPDPRCPERAVTLSDELRDT